MGVGWVLGVPTQKSACCVIPQNLSTKSLLLTGSLTNNINSQLTHIFMLYVLYTVFS